MPPAKKLAAGIDPNAEKKREALVAQLGPKSTFSAVALEFIDKKTKDGLAEATLKKAKWFTSLLDKSIAARPIGDIEPLEVLALKRKLSLPVSRMWQ